MKNYQLVSLLWLLSSMNGQNLVDLRTQTKNVDFSSAASTIPAKSGTTLPATCNPGEMFFDTANPPGQNLYTCAPANTWTQLAGGSGSPNGAVSTATAGQFGFYAANGSTIVGHTLAPADIPALSYQLPLTFTGTGAKTASSTGSLVSGDCANWDANGNIIDFGSPCSNVASGAPGQFAFYSTAGSALTAHTLAASDIPALSYQSPLTFTGTGAKTASSTGSFVSGDCANWDVNGNVIDSGAPCASGSANIGTGSTGQFAFYSANGSALTAHTLAASDIPALTYQAPLSFTGTGPKTASSTGTSTSNDCAKWDANGNVIDSGAPCATGSANIGTGTTGQFGFYSANGSALTAHTLAPTDIPALSYQSPLTFTGTGAKTASSTGSLVSGDCAKWDANGNIIDFGSPCASVSSGTPGQFAFYSAAGSALTSHTLAASDIPALPYQAPLTFTGTGLKTASSTGVSTNNDCAKWDANGNVIDSGAPCATGSANIGTGTAGQFGFYSANGAALTAHTLAASDIPALSYQAPLTFTGNGTRTASSTGTVFGNDCARWDTNGNVIDAGFPCPIVAGGTTGQFAFYSANGSTLTAHTLAASDIPALTYQAPLTFTGTGTKTASSTGTSTSNDCAKWDANGNVIDSGAPCASGSANIGTGTTGQFGFYSANGSALTAHTLAASDIPALSYQAPLSFTGSGTKTASSTGSVTSNNCAKWDGNGNVVDAGAPCGSGSGGGMSVPSSTTVGNVPQFSNTTGTALSAGLGVVTSVGSPGSDTNVPTEKSVRTAIASAAAAAGNLPAQTGAAGYLSTNGSVASWGNIATGGSGALDCATVPGVCDIVSAIVPLKPAANAWTGANDFSGAAFLRVVTGAGAPATGCSVATNVGSVYMRNDAQTTGASLYVCSQTASGTYSWELAQSSGASSLPVFNAAGSAVSDHMVTGRSSFFASAATISLFGSAVFTSATSYTCTANDLSSVAAVRVTQTSGTSVGFSITAGTATDNFSYICVGN